MADAESRYYEARELAQSAAHCLGCALGLNHDRCDWEDDDDDE